MIFKIIVGVFFSIAEMALNNISIVGIDFAFGGGTVEFLDLISKAAFFFPLDLLIFLFGLFGMSVGVLISWSFVEWCYKKIPGVN